MLVYDVRNVSKTYAGQARPANDGITLQIRQGEIFGLLGDNGAGKSTLVKQLANLVRPTAGEIWFRERPLAADPTAVALHVGYMPQDGLAFNSLTVGESLYFTAHLRGLSRRDARRERDRLLALWQLGPLRGRTPGQLSGGQKRLLQIAGAMAAAPPVLILDEPTDQLDPQRRQQVWQVLRTLNREAGTTIIFITHDAIEAEKIIQRVGIMHAGRLVALGRPAELKRQVDRQLRLELTFAPEQPPRLPAAWPVHELDAGRWLVYVPREAGTAVFTQIDLAGLEDFRLHSATLEDLYLHFATGAGAPERTA